MSAGRGKNVDEHTVAVRPGARRTCAALVWHCAMAPALRSVLCVAVVLCCAFGRPAAPAPSVSGGGTVLAPLAWFPEVLAARPTVTALVLRGGAGPDADADADAMADATADAMADEMADAMADEMFAGEEGGGGAGELASGGEEESEDPVRDLVEEGCAAWDDDNDADVAESAFRQALALDPGHPDALCSMGVLMHESGRDLAGAEGYFARALQNSPQHVDSLHYYGNLMHVQRRDDEAELMYKRAQETMDAAAAVNPSDPHPLTVDNLCNHGALLERVRHDVDAAEALYERALAVDPQHRSVLFNYGVLLEDARNESARAEAMYRQALLADPDDVDVLINLGLLLQHKSGDYGGAEECLERAVAAAPDRPDALVNLGVLLEEVRVDLEAAEDKYLAALKADPKDIVALCHYGGLLVRMGRSQAEADIYFEQAREVYASARTHILHMHVCTHTHIHVSNVCRWTQARRRRSYQFAARQPLSPRHTISSDSLAPEPRPPCSTRGWGGESEERGLDGERGG